MDGPHPCWASVSHSRLLHAPMGPVGDAAQHNSFNLILQTSYLISLTLLITSTSLHPVLRLLLCSASLSPLSLSLIRGHFHFKGLHYLPSLRAIRNGVTLSGRQRHGIGTTHPLSWGPLWGPLTLIERRTKAPSTPQPLLHTPADPSLWLVNDRVKRCVIKWRSKQVLFGCVTDFAGESWWMRMVWIQWWSYMKCKGEKPTLWD